MCKYLTTLLNVNSEGSYTFLASSGDVAAVQSNGRMD